MTGVNISPYTDVKRGRGNAGNSSLNHPPHPNHLRGWDVGDPHMEAARHSGVTTIYGYNRKT